MSDYCARFEPNGDQRCLCNEGALGPKNVADGSSPPELLHGYNRLGGLKPAAFLEKWRTVTKDPNGRPETHWLWPNADKQGFLLDINGNAIAGDITLEPGTLIDRFGHNDTVYFAPLATPFAMRSLPPSSLNPEQEYAVYEVMQTLRVKAGPIAPGFEQPGGGTQFIVEMGPEELYKGERWVRKLGKEEVAAIYNDWQ